MKRLFYGVFGVGLLGLWLALPTSALANDAISVDGQVRARAEVDKRSFDGSAVGNHYTDLRTRLNISALVSDNTRAVVQLQDSRRLGGTSMEGAPTSGTLTDGEGVDVHQAYLEIKRLWANGPGLKAGRFEVNLGNQRVFGAVGWHNVGRSWEGLAAKFPTKDVTATVYWLKRMELSDRFNNRDFDVLGLYTNIPSANLDIFGFLERDAANTGPDSTGAEASSRLNRIDLGIYTKQTFDSVDLEINAVVQTGDQASTGSGLLVEQDISAFLATAELGIAVSEGGSSRLAVGVDFASGDDDPTDDTNKAYNNLYYTGHKFRGFMDYFLGSNPEGLIDLMLRGRTSPAPGWTISADAHLFSTAQDYTDFEGEETKSVGMELDLGVKTTRIPGVVMQGGASVFLPSESFAGSTDSDPGLWLYSMFTANFGKK